MTFIIPDYEGTPSTALGAVLRPAFEPDPAHDFLHCSDDRIGFTLAQVNEGERSGGPGLAPDAHFTGALRDERQILAHEAEADAGGDQALDRLLLVGFDHLERLQLAAREELA